MTTFFDRDPADTFMRSVDQLGRSIELPADYTALKQRWEQFRELDTPATDRLCDAIITGDGDLAALRVGALAEVTPAHKIDAAVRHRIVAELQSIYAEHSPALYGTLAARFDKTAKAFTAAATAVDLDAEPAALMSAPTKQRDAWAQAEVLAGDLDVHLAALMLAARLHGHRFADHEAIPLACATEGLHRRRLWEAWHCTTGRGRRWAALVTLGATLRACPLDTFAPQPEPQPLIHRQEPIPGRPGHVHNVTIDPHDPVEAQPLPPIDPRRTAAAH